MIRCRLYHINWSTILLFFIVSACLNDPNTDNGPIPHELKAGKFIYKGENEGFIVVKTLDKQIEYNDSLEYRIDFNISWKSETEYDMIFLGGTKGCLQIGDTINVKIVSWTSTGYKYRAHSRRCGKSKGEFIKIE